MKDFCKEHPVATVLIAWSILGTIRYCAYAITNACSKKNIEQEQHVEV